MRHLLLISLFVPWLSPPLSAANYGRVDSSLLQAIVKVEAEPMGSQPTAVATGFLVSTQATPESDLYLVTNKHVVSDWTLADGSASTFRPSVLLYLYQAGLTPGTQKVRIPVPQRVFLHPDPLVDVALLVLEPADVSSAGVTLSSFALDYFLPYKKISVHLTGLGDQVYALGYPLGISSATTSLPIAKSGYLATPLDSPFSIEIATPSRSGRLTPRLVSGSIMLVDGLLVPGNSGSPVVLANELKSRREPTTNQLQWATIQSKNYIIGMASLACGNSGLTLVFGADYILDAISQFAKLRAHKPAT
jgi:hypothetical protein